MADAPGDRAPGEAAGEGAGKAPKRRKGEAPPPQQRFVLGEHVDSVVTLPWDVLRVDEDLTHGQVVPPLGPNPLSATSMPPCGRGVGKGAAWNV